MREDQGVWASIIGLTIGLAMLMFNSVMQRDRIKALEKDVKEIDSYIEQLIQINEKTIGLICLEHPNRCNLPAMDQGKVE